MAGVSVRPGKAMARVSLLAELPDALPERGVLLLQIRPGRIGPSNTVRSEFLKNLMFVYGNRHAWLVDQEYYDRPWQTLIQDRDVLQRIGKALQKIRDAGQHGAVLVRIIIQGIDNTAWRHEEIEQNLVQLLTERGAVVSLIEATGSTKAQAMLYRPSSDGEPSMTQEKIDLKPYLDTAEPTTNDA
jgi:hypothetical protein